MASTPLALSRVKLPTFSWRGSMFTIMKPLGGNMCLEQSLWILNLALWTLCGVVLMARSSGLITLSLARAEQETTGPRGTTLRAQSLSTVSLMLSGRRLKAAIACRVFNLRTPWVEELDQAW